MDQKSVRTHTPLVPHRLNMRPRACAAPHPVLRTCDSIRDKYGKVVEGSAKEIRANTYLWKLVQDAHGSYLGKGYIPPRWLLRDCQHVASMDQIV